MSIRTNLTGRASSPPLALKCLNWQGLHEFSVNTDINVCCSDLTCLRELSAPGWWRNKWQLIIQHTALALNKSEWFVHFFFFHIAVVVMYWEARVLIHQQKHISRTLFVLCVIYNKPYCRCVVRIKLNSGPSACRTVCGEPYGLIFFRERSTPSLHYISIV